MGQTLMLTNSMYSLTKWGADKGKYLARSHNVWTEGSDSDKISRPLDQIQPVNKHLIT